MSKESKELDDLSQAYDKGYKTGYDLGFMKGELEGIEKGQKALSRIQDMFKV